MKKNALFITFVLVGFIFAQNNIKTKVNLNSIPENIFLYGKVGEVDIISDNSFSLSTNHKTDLYISPEGDYIQTNAPIMLFEPSKDFTLTASIECEFIDAYQGASIVLYESEKTWVKFLFELNHKTEKIVCSNFTDDVSDDNIHLTVSKNKVYLRIAKKAELYVFYISEDGDSWNYYKMFKQKNSVKYKIGFGIQSPEGKKFTAIFSEINYVNKPFKDFWEGL